MNNIKIIYYNIEVIDSRLFDNTISSNPNVLSRYEIKPGLMLVNFRGTSQALYISLGELIHEKNIFIHDLDSDIHAYYGYMNKDIWEWLKQNRQ